MDIRDVLSELGANVAPEGHHHSRDGWVNWDCPWCGQDTSKYHMGYNTRGGYVNCWQCGPHSLIDTLMELSGRQYHQIKDLLKNVDRGKRYEERLKPTGKLELPSGLGPLLKPHRKYLRGRGYDVDQLVALWNLQGIGINASLGWRIFIPITYNGKVVSWTTRAIVDSGVRYLSAKSSQEAYSHKDLLFGEDYCRHACIVHEGPLDVFRTGPGATATCGVGYSRAQVMRISKYPLRVICFDNQLEAQVRARKLCDELEPFPGETVNVVLDSKDAGSAKDKEIKRLRAFLKG